MKFGFNPLFSLLSASVVCISATGALAEDAASYVDPWSKDEKSTIIYERTDGADGSTVVTVTSGNHNDGDITGGKSTLSVKETTIILNGGENIKRIIGGNEDYGYVEGDRNIIINGGEADYIYGGDWYVEPNRGGGYITGYDKPETFGVQSSSDAWCPKKSVGDINITVNGGKIGQIRGGHNCADGVNIDPKLNPKIDMGWSVDENGNATDKRPYSVGGDVNILISGGTVGTGSDDAIRGAGGSWCSVDGNVNITVEKEALVIGNIYAGARNKYGQVGGTSVTITGGRVEGDIYAGGSYSSQSTITQGDTAVTLSGGEITGSVYAAGDRDIVQGGTSVTIKGAGSSVGGNISGGGGINGATIKGARVLVVDASYAGTHEYSIKDFTQADIDASISLSEIATAAEGTDITLADGTTLTLNSVLVTEGALVFNGGLGTVAFAEGANLTLNGTIIDLGGTDVKLGSDLTLQVADVENVGDNVTLFEQAGEGSVYEGVTITFTDAAGGTKTAKLTRDADGSIHTAAVPEPTTATLSLLALAALCARRRRR